MFTLQELGSDLHKLKLLNYMSKSPSTSFVKKYANVYMALLLCRLIYTKLWKR
jgi:hypothetical protein